MAEKADPIGASTKIVDETYSPTPFFIQQWNSQLEVNTYVFNPIVAGDGLAGGGVLVDGEVTLSLPDVGTAGTYGSATEIPVVTTDPKGRVIEVVLEPISTTGAITAQDDGTSLGSFTTFNFVGPNWTLTDAGNNVLNLQVSQGAKGVVAQDDGVGVVAEATTLNFVGAGVQVVDAGSGEAEITIVGGIPGVTVEDDGALVTTSPTLNFTGAGVVVTDTGTGVANVAISGGTSGVDVEDDGVTTVSGATTLNFAGSGVVVTDAGSNNATVTIAGGGGGTSGVDVEDDGVSVATAATTFNFTGAGVAVTDAGSGQVDVAIAGGGGGGGGSYKLYTVTNKGFEDGNLTGWTETTTGQWAVTSGTFFGVSGPDTGTYYLTCNTPTQSDPLYQDITLDATSSGGEVVEISYSAAFAIGRDTHTVSLVFLDSSGTELGRKQNRPWGDEGAGSPWYKYIVSAILPANVATVRIELISTNHSGTNAAAALDSFSDLSVSGGSSGGGGGGGGGGTSGVDVEDDGVSVATAATTFNFTGAGVAVTDAGSGQVDVAITGGGGGGGTSVGSVLSAGYNIEDFSNFTDAGKNLSLNFDGNDTPTFGGWTMEDFTSGTVDLYAMSADVTDAVYDLTTRPGTLLLQMKGNETGNASHGLRTANTLADGESLVVKWIVPFTYGGNGSALRFGIGQNDLTTVINPSSNNNTGMEYFSPAVSANDPAHIEAQGDTGDGDVAPGLPIYMRMSRVGSTLYFLWSQDGKTWAVQGSVPVDVDWDNMWVFARVSGAGPEGQAVFGIEWVKHVASTALDLW